MTPIGTFTTASIHPQDAPRQAVLARDSIGTVELLPGRNFEQALRDLAGFDRLWLVFLFHHNQHWRPTTQPPGWPHRVGVFASRAPYRPNPIGLSCVRLVAIDGLRITVAEHDLLDGTPILDIKPYIPYADAFPDARAGWVDERHLPTHEIRHTSEALARLQWLELHHVHLRPFISAQLRDTPTDGSRKRITKAPSPGSDSGGFVIAWRTWRIVYHVDRDAMIVTILTIHSGYSAAERSSPGDDPYHDKLLHAAFTARFPSDT